MTLPDHPGPLARRAALPLLLLLACLPPAAPQHPCAAAPAEEVRELRLRQPRWSDLICIGGQRIRYGTGSSRRGERLQWRGGARLAALLATSASATAVAATRALLRCRYQLRGLQRNTPYEVRISYPATVSKADWVVSLCCQ